jgi:hypothetical protein
VGNTETGVRGMRRGMVMVMLISGDVRGEGWPRELRHGPRSRGRRRYSISSSSAAAGSQTQIRGRSQGRVREARATIQANSDQQTLSRAAEEEEWNGMVVLLTHAARLAHLLPAPQDQ